MSLGELLQNARKRASISVEQLAFNAGVSIGTIRAVEQSRRMPSAPALKAILLALPDIEGHWHSDTLWEDPSGDTHLLARFPGDNRQVDQPKMPTNDELRLYVMRQVLDADPLKLQAISLLLEN